MTSSRAEQFPLSVDINPTAVCNLHCSFCWGPDHAIPDSLDTAQWRGVIDFFADRGTENIVFTGGEPLVRRDIVDLIQHAKNRKLGVTLSTNTLLLDRYADRILPLIDRIGIPIDGSSPAMNQRMRLGNPRSFETAVSALDRIGEDYPDIFVSLRTVVSKINQDDVPNIGEVLSVGNRRVNQWILYQFAPVSIGAAHADEHFISDADFARVAALARERYPTLPIVDYASEQRTGRYVFVGPEGNIFGVGDDGQYVHSGSFLTDGAGDLEQAVIGVFDMTGNIKHTYPSQ